jgi:hypothetical protein
VCDLTRPEYSTGVPAVQQCGRLAELSMIRHAHSRQQRCLSSRHCAGARPGRRLAWPPWQGVGSCCISRAETCAYCLLPCCPCRLVPHVLLQGEPQPPYPSGTQPQTQLARTGSWPALVG